MKYDATWSTDGSGDWSVTLPVDFDEHDLDALGSVVRAIKTFVEPTIDPDARPEAA